jgi:thiamine biosynthesis lipoprotein
MLRYLLFLAFLFFQNISIIGQFSTSKEIGLMGCRFVINVTAEDETIAWQAIHTGIAEIQRIESLISSWKPTSQTSDIVRNAGIKPVVVDEELLNLIERAGKISKLTQGAFDISFASMDRIYTFDGKNHELPAEDTLKKAISLIDWQKIAIDHKNKTVFLPSQHMKIGFGGIGKGYAANRAKAKMAEIPGVQGGIVNASGDLFIWGKQADGSENWNIQISDPQNPDVSLANLDVKNTAVVTSGNYEKYFFNNGNRYAHIINPRTGLPTTGIKSATVICPDAEIADALATSIFVLGKEDGIFLIDNLNGIEAIIVTDDDKIITSKNIQLNYK